MTIQIRFLLLISFLFTVVTMQNCAPMGALQGNEVASDSGASLAIQCNSRSGDGIIGSPTNTFLISGDGQSARVLSEAPNHLIMQVTDADGDSVPGVQVAWTVFEGTGEILQSVSTTNAQGCAGVVRFRLGTQLGRQQVRGEVPGLAPVYFAITGTALESGGLQLVSGQFQSASPNQAVMDPIVFRVVNGSGQPLAGGSVSFSVLAGGGTVSPSAAVSDSQGLVRISNWTLGSAVGVQRVRATLSANATLDVQATAVATGAPVLQISQFMTGFNRAWDLAFSPTGAMFVTERPGELSVIRNGQRLVIARPSDVSAQDQSGLLGVAVDPEFSTNRFIYTYMSSNRSGSMDNRIRRWRVSADYSSAVEDRDILTGISWGAQGAHSGGRIRFGPDGFLYVTTGDIRTATVPQDRRVLGSKVLRITRDGMPAPGNPQWAAGERREIFSFGFRNPQGLAFRPGSGQMFTCEHGPNLNDEVTLVLPGGNGGWDPNDGNGNYDGYSRRNAQGVEVGAPSTDLVKFPNALRPTYVVADSQGMGGCNFLVGPQWRNLDGALAVGLMAGGQIHYVRMNSVGTATVSTGQPSIGMDRVRTVVQGPDGAAYVIIDAAAPNGRIMRMVPQ